VPEAVATPNTKQNCKTSKETQKSPTKARKNHTTELDLANDKGNVDHQTISRQQYMGAAA